MLEQEIIETFQHRTLNEKNNNYIFTGIEDFGILESIPDRCSVSIRDHDVDIPFAQNIIVNLEEVLVYDILSYTLEELKKLKLLDVYLDYTLDFQRWNLFKFEHILKDCNSIVQMLVFNVEALTLGEQMLFNELYYFNSIYFNVNSFIQGEHFSTHFLTGNRVLDDRENYTKIELIRKIG